MSCPSPTPSPSAAAPVAPCAGGAAAAAAEPTPAVLIGAGQRGIVYSNYALDRPDLLRIVAVAEPHEARRLAVAQRFALPADRCFSDWRALLSAGGFAAGTVAIVATPDAQHVEPAVALARAGFHLLLEKPMGTLEADCRAIADAVEQSGVMAAVCHVLRYTPLNRRIHSLLREGRIGRLVSMQHLEPVGHSHFAHSYVRGNWSRTADSSFSLLAKSCHDIDLLQWWAEAQGGVGSNPVQRVSSFGGLQHFRPENKPAAAAAAGAMRCLDCPSADECTYAAQRLYLTPLRDPSFKGWRPAYLHLLDTAVPDIENVTQALRTGPYGRCVYGGHNDVCDHQVVSLQFSGGQSASFSMVAFSEKTCTRQTTLFGTEGEIRCDGKSLTLVDFRTNSTHSIAPLEEEGAGCDVGRLTGHDGADFFLMQAFVRAVRENDPSLIPSNALNSLHSHLIVFAAEQARLNNTVVECKLSPTPQQA